MNVEELREHLKLYPDDMEVVIRGYEGGYTTIKFSEEIEIEFYVNPEDYYGEHDNPGRAEFMKIPKHKVKRGTVVQLSGDRH